MTDAAAAPDVPVRPAATVMLVRDGDDGLEVFMMRRTFSASFASGMWVFPGGRVDDADGAGDLGAVCDGLDDTTASRLLGVPSGGLAYWVAATRECFEEAGVLLARSRTPDGLPGPVIAFDRPDTVERFERARHDIHDGRRSLHDLCTLEGLVLTTDAMHYVSHWITPKGEGKRFDTRFFLAAAPSGQSPLHDDSETIDSFWVSPVEALERRGHGDLALMPPTIANLEFIAPHATTEAAVAAAAAVGVPRTILPKVRLDASGRFVGVAMPDDPDYASLP